MKTIGNVIWLVFGGWLAGLAYLAGTVSWPGISARS